MNSQLLYDVKNNVLTMRVIEKEDVVCDLNTTPQHFRQMMIQFDAFLKQIESGMFGDIEMVKLN